MIAGAGSGKTRVIVHRVAFMLENGISPDEILLLTFTRKAAAEMLGRVQQLLNDNSAQKVFGGHSIPFQTIFSGNMQTC